MVRGFGLEHAVRLPFSSYHSIILFLVILNHLSKGRTLIVRTRAWALQLVLINQFKFPGCLLTERWEVLMLDLLKNLVSASVLLVLARPRSVPRIYHLSLIAMEPIILRQALTMIIILFAHL